MNTDMQKTSVQSIIQALNHHRVQYLIAGGLAVVAHGYTRFTADLDLLLSVDSPNLQSAIAALQSLGYQPRAPVRFEDFANAANRQRWIAEKNMIVFSLWSPNHPATEIDLFVEPPVEFPAAFARRLDLEIAPGLTAHFCGFEDLIAMKTKAGRPRDQEDIAKLLRIKSEPNP